jgi:hypothetical protein
MSYSASQIDVKSDILASVNACARFVLERLTEHNKPIYTSSLKKCISFVEQNTIEDAKLAIESYKNVLISKQRKGFIGIGQVDNLFSIMACNHVLDCIRSIVVRFATGTPYPDPIYSRKEIV